MTRLIEVVISGVADVGRFEGRMSFAPGLQVISAANSYGKSLAASAIPWCLGLEPMFGVPDDDPSYLPVAVRDEFDVPGHPGAKVQSSVASIKLLHADGRQLGLSREIKGNPSVVDVEETGPDGTVRRSRLAARRGAMHDEHGGLQRFMFEWLGWPRVEVATFRGQTTDVYMENLAPLFFVDQQEGWTDLQARQIRRFQQVQIGQVAVEYLLGALDAVNARREQQTTIQREAALRGRARAIADQVAGFLGRNGWQVKWSGSGAIQDTLDRWRELPLREALRRGAGIDLVREIDAVRAQSAAIRKKLTTDPIDPSDASALTSASQRAIELKKARHELSEELSATRAQAEQAAELADSLEHRMRAANDVLRLKRTGVGRLETIECPTCHRDIDPIAFALTDQPNAEVEAHVEALKRDRELIRRNLDVLIARVGATSAELARVSDELREAETALATVNAAVGTVREQFGLLAADLSAAERQAQRLADVSKELESLQESINEWMRDAQEVRAVEPSEGDLKRRVGAFTKALREYLLALGHSAVTAATQGEVRLDDEYVSFLGQRRLKSLGSASDLCRLVGAYSLALAAASSAAGGLHPGFVVLDEPLQQNPDEEHRQLFKSFVSTTGELRSSFQTVIFTSLRGPEITALRKKGILVDAREGDHFLSLVEEVDKEPAPNVAEA
jgi:uncharacterized coiled-coil DUF342 family protein